MTTVNKHKHYLHGGPYAVCGCHFKGYVELIGMMCMRCGQRFRGPFVTRRGKQVYTEIMSLPHELKG